MLKSVINAIGFVLFPFRPDYFPELDLKLRYIISFLQNVAFAGLLCIIGAHIAASLRAAALSILTALSFFAVGSLVGFILALPRMANDNPSATAPKTDETRKASLIGFNNNLVDISDWITKSILALSIANYRDLVPALQGAAAYLAVDNTSVSRTEAMVIVVGYSSIGILYAYITTRTVVTSILVDSANALSPKIIKAVDDAGRGAVKALDASQQGDEPRRTTESISPDERAAANLVADQAAGLPRQAIRDQFEQLARKYADVRSNQKPGSERTAAMEEIVGKMRALSLAAQPLLAELKAADQAGLRLAAISILEMKPDPNEAEWLVERLTTESPFVGYHAAIALREAAAIVPCEVKQEFLSLLKKARVLIPPGSDRARVIEDTLQKVAERCKD